MKKALNILDNHLCFDVFNAPYRCSYSQICTGAVSSTLSGTYRFALEKDGSAKSRRPWIGFCIIFDRPVWADF